MLMLSEAWRLILKLQAALKLTRTINNSLKYNLDFWFFIFKLLIPGYFNFELLNPTACLATHWSRIGKADNVDLALTSLISANSYTSYKKRPHL